MLDPKSKLSLMNLGNALDRLHEALQETSENSLVIDGTIQRFEFVIELFWKTFKRLLKQEGIHTTTPRESLQEAYQAEWIHNEQAWIQMLKDRNETSHVYNEDLAREIYDRIKKHYPVLEEAYMFLKEKFTNK